MVNIMTPIGWLLVTTSKKISTPRTSFAPLPLIVIVQYAGIISQEGVWDLNIGIG